MRVSIKKQLGLYSGYRLLHLICSAPYVDIPAVQVCKQPVIHNK